MKEVCLIWEEGGSYDSAYSNVILAFETKEEGDKAVASLTAELEALKKIPEAADRFNQKWNAWARGEEGAVKYCAEDRGPMWEQAREEYEADVRAALKVYPYENKLDDGRVVVNVPSTRSGDDVTFHAAMMPISKLVDTLTSSAKRDG